MKRKKVSEPSCERIDHVYSSTPYLSLCSWSSSFSPTLSLSLSPSVILCSSHLTSSLLLPHLHYMNSPPLPFVLVFIAIFEYNAKQQHRDEMRGSARSFVSGGVETAVASRVRSGRKFLPDQKKVEMSISHYGCL